MACIGRRDARVDGLTSNRDADMNQATAIALSVYGALVAADAASLTVEKRIPLGEVRGRIDHLALDTKRQRLYVAELGNNSLGVVDLRAGRVITTVAGLHEPQGVAYVADTDTVWVANG